VPSTPHSATPPSTIQVPVTERQQKVPPIPTHTMLSATAARAALEMGHQRPGPRLSPTTPTNSQSEMERLRAMLPAGHIVAVSSQAQITELQRKISEASGPPPRWNTVSLARLPGFNGRTTPSSSGSVTTIPRRATSSIRGLSKSEGRKRPATDSAATSTGRKTANDFPLKQVERARASTDRTRDTTTKSHSSPSSQSSNDLPSSQVKRARVSPDQIHHTPLASFYSSPPSNDADAPSSRSYLRSARRDGYHVKPLVEAQDETPCQDIPQPSIETPILPAIRTRGRPMIPSGNDTGPSNTGTLRFSLNTQSTVVSEHSHGFDNMLEETRRVAEIRREYNIPDILLSVRAGMGQTDWMMYLELMEKFVDGKLDERKLNLGERVLFQVQDEKLRRRIRMLVKTMVIEARGSDE
jgi:hypothetical protein